ncbi:MAG: putative transport system permease protein [Acidimicrobiaceae bacterium]|nr:putative transport system permease protein [Acidimicrobiaceae bacterium]
MRTRGGARLAARLARREVRRRPWRSALVALLVAGPVAGMTAATVLVRTNHLTAMQEWRFNSGQADAVLPARAAGDLPPGSRAVPFETDYPLLRTAAGDRVRAQVTSMPLADPMAKGVFSLRSGRGRVGPGEVVLSSHAAHRLHVRLHDVLHVERPVAQDLTVVGVGEAAGWKDTDVVALEAGRPFGWRTQSEPALLVDLPAGVTGHRLDAWLKASLAKGGGVSLAPDLTAGLAPGSPSDNATRVVAWSWVIGAAALTVIGIVIAAAFAAGARRQLTTMGQLAANGATPKMLRRMLLLQGTWTGVVGAAGGLMLGFVLLAAGAPYRYQLLGRDVGPYKVHVPDLVPAVLLGVIAATMAALIPARTASRTPVLAALAGRRPVAPVPAWLATAGGITIGGGLALLALSVLGAKSNANGDVWTLTGGVGGMAVLLGACAVAPAYVSCLEPVAARLRGTWRLAARSLARQRTRTSAVVAAVAAATALAVAASAVVLAVDTQRRHRSPLLALDQVQVVTTVNSVGGEGDTQPPPVVPVPSPPELVDRMRAVLPSASVLRLTTLTPAVDGPSTPLVGGFTPDHRGQAEHAGDPQAVSNTTVAALADADAMAAYKLDRVARSALDRDGAVAFAFGASGRVGLGAPSAAVPIRVLDRGRYSVGSLPQLLLTRARAQSLGLVAQPTHVVFQLPEPLTAEQRDQARGVLEDYDDLHPVEIVVDPAVRVTRPSTTVDFAVPESGPDPLVLETLLALLALGFCLFVVAVNLALAAAETREERDTLTVVGAAPRTISRANGHKALLLSLLGAGLGIPVGLVPVFVLTRVDAGNLPFVMPWRLLAALAVAVPLVAAAATNAASAVGLRLRPAQVSTMAFD